MGFHYKVNDSRLHVPVLFEESIKLLAIKPDGIYLDGTFGRGGHARGILAQLNEHGRLFACDKDPDAINYAKHQIHDTRVTLLHSSFANIAALLKDKNIRLDGIILDLGVSSPQLDEAHRGFSLRLDGLLDMRMDTSCGITASSWLNSVNEDELADVLWQYGEERFSRRIARNIALSRAVVPITHTMQLAKIIADSIPGYTSGTHKQHKATRSFQAIRIFINRELDDLKIALDTLPALLNQHGRMVVISFHSLEDRLVKTQFTALSSPQSKQLPKWVTVTSNDTETVRYKIVAKKMRASINEVTNNSRSRSAVLRCLELAT